MSKCSHCLQGICRKHPLQDHGERAAQLQKKLKESQSSLLSNRNAMIQAEIQRLAEKLKGTHEDENDFYKTALEADRKAVMMSSSKSTGQDPALQGLNPAVSSIMMRNYDSDEGTDRKKRKKRKSDDSDSDSSASKKKRKKHKKEKKRKKGKDRKKESKKHHDKRSRSESSSSDSDSDTDNHKSN